MVFGLGWHLAVYSDIRFTLIMAEGTYKTEDDETGEGIAYINVFVFSSELNVSLSQVKYLSSSIESFMLYC